MPLFLARFVWWLTLLVFGAVVAAIILLFLAYFFDIGRGMFAPPVEQYLLSSKVSPQGGWRAVGTYHLAQNGPLGGGDSSDIEVVVKSQTNSTEAVVLAGDIDPKRLKMEWLSEQELRITTPARNQLWTRLRAFSGVKITLRFVEDKPELYRAWRQERVRKEMQPLYDDVEMVSAE